MSQVTPSTAGRVNAGCGPFQKAAFYCGTPLPEAERRSPTRVVRARVQGKGHLLSSEAVPCLVPIHNVCLRTERARFGA